MHLSLTAMSAPPSDMPPTLPTELICKIVSITIASHLDCMIAGELRKPDWELDIFELLTPEVFAAARAKCDQADPMLAPSNQDPTRALLRTSAQMREISLAILSDLLGIPLRPCLKAPRITRCA